MSAFARGNLRAAGVCAWARFRGLRAKAWDVLVRVRGLAAVGLREWGLGLLAASGDLGCRRCGAGFAVVGVRLRGLRTVGACAEACGR